MDGSGEGWRMLVNMKASRHELGMVLRYPTVCQDWRILAIGISYNLLPKLMGNWKFRKHTRTHARVGLMSTPI